MGPTRSFDSSSPPKNRLILPLAIAIWLATATVGLAVLWDYENAPGEAATAPAEWPLASRLAAPTGQARLVVLAHPKCPCTRATIRELERLMAENHGRLEADVLFTTPVSAPPTSHHTDLFYNVRKIPGVRVHRDEGGVEASRFGSATSGQTLLYDADGELLFPGGITAGRGHEGDNLGRSTIYALLHDDESGTETSSVFGCALHTSGLAS